MEYCPENSKTFLNILNLPVELLVYIASFLPTCDKVKLRYVSKGLQVVSETPSLWSEFVWPHYDRRQKRSVINVLKACGEYIKTLIFPDHVTSPTLFKMLRLCKNVTQLYLSLETMLDPKELKTAVQHMNQLEKLEVQLCNDFKPLLQIVGLKELTIHVPGHCQQFCAEWIQEWMSKGCVPYALNVVTEVFESKSDEEINFFWSLLDMNFIPLKGYSSSFKLYYAFQMPLKLIPSLPEFQLDIGETATLPFVKGSEFGVFLDEDILVLTDCICGSKKMCKAETISDSLRTICNIIGAALNKVINNLHCVTEFSFVYTFSVHSGHLEQLAVACLNLQRLNLEKNNHCLKSLKGLRMIASHCHDLRGLNLRCISASDMESCIGLWQVLSDMRLTHLVIDVCASQPVSVIDGKYDSICEQQMISLFQKCSNLQALQIDSYYCDGICELCYFCEVKWPLLSYFPTLKYCRLSGNHSNLIQDVIPACKGLMVFCCSSEEERLLISSVYTSNLQQIYIDSLITDIPKNFMETVSAHGRLIHVIMYAKSVIVEGITHLVVNSPGLLNVLIHARIFEHNNEPVSDNALESIRDRLKVRFPTRKLFTAGHFILTKDCYLFDELYKTDLQRLWRFYPLI